MLPVVAFHAGVPGFSGGYLGVDVFFVISGYLITGILLSSLERGDFSVRRFYERRVRRILPAYFLVLGVTLLFGAVVLPPASLADVARSAVSSLLFLSNVWFWSQAGYFADPSETNPLIHTWSLSVEEQFYLLFPLFLALLWRVGRRPLLFRGVGFGLVVSILLSEYMSSSHHSANFFLAPFRAWELAAGALLAIHGHPAERIRARLGPWIAEGLCVICALALLSSFVTFDDRTRTPGLITLVPVAGTVGLLALTDPTRGIGRLLAAPPLVGIGLLSYSLYLWHQPLLAFARTVLGEPGPRELGLVVLGSLMLAWITWYLVERPFRNSSRVSLKTLTWSMGSCFVAGGALSAGLVITDGLPQRFHGYPHEDLIFIDRAQLRDATWAPVDAARSADTGRIAIVGDSHAKDVFNALVLGGCADPGDLRPLISNRECAAALGDQAAYDDCAYGMGYVADDLDRIDRVVLAPSWRAGWMRRIESVAGIARGWNRPTLILLPTPAFPDVLSRIQQSMILRLTPEQAEARIAGAVRTREIADLDQRLRSVWGDGALVADRFSFVCPGGRCDLLGNSDVPLFSDSTHWTLAGAREFGRRMCADPTVAQFLQSAGEARQLTTGGG